MLTKGTGVLTIKNMPASVLTGSDVNKALTVTTVNAVRRHFQPTTIYDQSRNKVFVHAVPVIHIGCVLHLVGQRCPDAAARINRTGHTVYRPVLRQISASHVGSGNGSAAIGLGAFCCHTHRLYGRPLSHFYHDFWYILPGLPEFFQAFPHLASKTRHFGITSPIR